MYHSKPTIRKKPKLAKAPKKKTPKKKTMKA